MTSRGYSTFLVQDINDAVPFWIGVKLAKRCIALNIPIKDVAEYLGVSRPTVYAWFTGKREVSRRYVDKVEELIEKLA
jgi:transcriptional regulator with XRE-family HTH domain